MKRDWDLIREILIQASDTPIGQMMDASGIKGWDYNEVCAHISILHDAGYVRAKLVKGHAIVVSALVMEITMSGYDLLDTLKSQSVWLKIKEVAKEKGIELSFDAIKTLGAFALKHVLGSQLVG